MFCKKGCGAPAGKTRKREMEELDEHMRMRIRIARQYSKFSAFTDLGTNTQIGSGQFLSFSSSFRGKFCEYRSDTANSNTVNSKFHLIRSLGEDFTRFLSFHV